MFQVIKFFMLTQTARFTAYSRFWNLFFLPSARMNFAAYMHLYLNIFFEWFNFCWNIGKIVHWSSTDEWSVFEDLKSKMEFSPLLRNALLRKENDLLPLLRDIDRLDDFNSRCLSKSKDFPISPGIITSSSAVSDLSRFVYFFYRVSWRESNRFYRFCASQRVRCRCFYGVSLFYDKPRAALPSESSVVAASTELCKLIEKKKCLLYLSWIKNTKQNCELYSFIE